MDQWPSEWQQVSCVRCDDGSMVLLHLTSVIIIWELNHELPREWCTKFISESNNFCEPCCPSSDDADERQGTFINDNV